jgi:hypothetical protein
MKRHANRLAAASILVAVLTSLAFGAPQASPKRGLLSRLSLEVTGGWARGALDDLNLFPAYDEGRIDHYYRKQYEALKAQKGAYYSFARIEKSGQGFSRLHGLFPAGLRLSLDLGYGWTACLGLSYLTGRADSAYREVYDISDLDPNKMELENVYRQEIDYPSHRLALKAWSPTLGIRLRIPIVRRVALAGYLSAGLLAAAFDWEREYQITSTDEKGRWSRSIVGASASGRGSGPTLEGCARLDYAVSGRLTAFLEAGYAYRKTGRVDGDYATWTGHEDSDSAPYESRFAYADGVFWTRIQTISSAWGVWTPRTVFFADAQAQRDSRNFILDLSGVELRLGLAWRL